MCFSHTGKTEALFILHKNWFRSVQQKSVKMSEARSKKKSVLEKSYSFHFLFCADVFAVWRCFGPLLEKHKTTGVYVLMLWQSSVPSTKLLRHFDVYQSSGYLCFTAKFLFAWFILFIFLLTNVHLSKISKNGNWTIKKTYKSAHNNYYLLVFFSSLSLKNSITSTLYCTPCHILILYCTSFFALHACYPCIYLEPLLNCTKLCPVSSSLTRVSLGSIFLAASVGHAVQTDQRSHDKERANTGAHSGPWTNSI